MGAVGVVGVGRLHRGRSSCSFRAAGVEARSGLVRRVCAASNGGAGWVGLSRSWGFAGAQIESEIDGAAGACWCCGSTVLCREGFFFVLHVRTLPLRCCVCVWGSCTAGVQLLRCADAPDVA